MTDTTFRNSGMNRVFMQRGLSLVELMIALLLSTLLTLGILTMYLDSSETSRLTRSLARIQESGRIALDLIARDLRMAGFAGCANPLQVQEPDFTEPTLDEDFYTSSVRGARVKGNGWNEFVNNVGIGALDAAAVPGSDVVQIRRAGASFVVLDVEGDIITTDSDSAISEFRVGEHAFITACDQALIFTVGDSSGLKDNQIRTQETLNGNYNTGAYVHYFNTKVYWIGDTGRDDAHGNDIWALYQNDLEVVTGVERMQILYGVKDGSATSYQTAEDMADEDWNQVAVVQVGLLVSDEQRVLETADTKTYQLPGLKVQPEGAAGAEATYPDDGRLRATFTMTVNLRNRIDE